MTKCLTWRCEPCAEEGTALLEKAAGQGHVYAMFCLAQAYHAGNQHEKAVEWFAKAAETGLPKATFSLGCCLEQGEGVAAPDYPAAVGWYKCAAAAGNASAANNLCSMYTVGRGRASQIMPVHARSPPYYSPRFLRYHVTWRAISVRP